MKRLKFKNKTSHIFNPEILFLDCDGVILESVSVKAEAFGKMFSKPLSLKRKVIDYHLKNIGVSRFEKFKHIYLEFLGQKITQRKLRSLNQIFSKLVYKNLLLCPLVKGVKSFIGKVSKKIDIYVVSASPEEELKRVLKRRGLHLFFKKMYGSPKTKVDIFKKILTDRKVKPQKALYIGDGYEDWNAAQKVRIPFIGRVPREKKSPFLKETFIVRDFHKLMPRFFL